MKEACSLYGGLGSKGERMVSQGNLQRHLSTRYYVLKVAQVETQTIQQMAF